MSKPRRKPLAVSSEEEQHMLLEEAKKKVSVESFYMKRCLDTGKLMDALKHASNMIGQLRTSMLSPKNYYALYISAFDELRFLESYLTEERKKGERMSKLYELVQYAGNILPRLYLLITVGSVYIKSKEAPAKDVLRDLVEMCKGIQHPTRGLFIRNYLSEMTKDKLPDTGSEYEGDGGTVVDSIDFVLQNFIEMNKLWVRMQHQGAAQLRDRREMERKELCLLVGKNLARMSQLDGVDLDIYQEQVLPSITEQIVNCKDRIAQQYLMECVIQVFPDEFHLKTLGVLLTTCGQLQPDVDTKAIVVSLMNRLAQYAVREQDGVPTEVNVFEVFYEHFAKLNDSSTNMPPEHVLQLQVALMNLSFQCYPDNLAYIDQLLQLASDTLGVVKAAGQDISRQPVAKQICNLLTTPLDSFKNILTVLKLEHYAAVMDYLTHAARKRVSTDIAKNAIENTTHLESPDQVERLFTFISPLIEHGDDDELDLEDLETEHNLVASLVHLFKSDDLETLFAMYVLARKWFVKCAGAKVSRLKYTAPPLMFGALRLAETVRAMGEEMATSAKKVFKFVHETLKLLAQAQDAELALRLYLQAGSSAGTCGFEQIAYEFFTQAFVLYEESISDSAAQVRAVQLIIGTLQATHCFDAENYDRLITKTAGHSSKLLKKPDQCRCVYKCSHLFFKDGEAESDQRDDKRVLECLQKSIKIADTCIESAVNVQLFVEILNQYLYYYMQESSTITVKYVNSLISLINTNMANMEQAPENQAIQDHYQHTLRYIEYRKTTASSEGHRAFDEIVI